MNKEVLDTKGNLASGILCLYVTRNGPMLFSESAREEGDTFVFDASRTCVITVGVAADRKTHYNIQKAVNQFGGPTKLIVPKSALVMIQDMTDRALLGNMRSAISGLVIVN